MLRHDIALRQSVDHPPAARDENSRPEGAIRALEPLTLHLPASLLLCPPRPALQA